MASAIKFGTDGWRAAIAEEYTFDNVRIVTQAVADYLHESGLAPRGLVVGYDTRFGSERFAAATAEVLAANGIHVYLTEKATPTPVVCWSILSKKAGGASIITASHNPPSDNGYKYKPEYAGSASPDVIARLEDRLEKAPVKRMTLREAEKQGLVERINGTPDYVAQIKQMVDLEAIKREGWTIINDAMYGAGAGFLPLLLDGGQTKVVPINDTRNPLFPGMRSPEPIDDNLTKLKNVVKQSGAFAGLAYDGDADRVGLVDEKGKFVDQLRVFGLLTYYLLEVKGWRGPIVKSLSTTSMVNRLAELYNVPIYETPVGFKHIGPKMIESNAIIGGEESGGFAFAKHLPERDGILSSLLLLDLFLKRGKTPSETMEELLNKVGPHFYDRIDINYPAEQRDTILKRVDAARPDALAGLTVNSINTQGGYKYYLQDGSWLLIRFSGTEPLLRIYTETRSPELVEKLLAEGRVIAGA
ncbi:phosphoglucomutase/phosphomannomutase family protein [Herpetosiphon giganteus]|uniref:phosphoglucomutase/phosphomannomutase family protein n=1 Tax=Herpetosiphon giganteus TaxID=2029754 RepID=UPI00195D9E43|nr:phosphoglucomutase/phosphomannomutase family protein [Herpetosiphon giganteus]MBM7841533.1 alpha-D-glucose phosphate-specific phosphoglucomutase [Herpetosiphon giganteus]